jgi:hypothetical protein
MEHKVKKFKMGGQLSGNNAASNIEKARLCTNFCVVEKLFYRILYCLDLERGAGAGTEPKFFKVGTSINPVFFRGSGMFIPDPRSEFFSIPARIQDQKYSGSGSASKNLCIFNPKNCSRKYVPGCSSRIRIPDPVLDFFPIPNPGSRGQKGTGFQFPDMEHC